MILILGSKGMLGAQLINVYGDDAVGWDHSDIDLTDFTAVKSKILNLKFLPGAIINCAGFNDVDAAEQKKQQAFKLNAEVPEFLALLCGQLAIPLVQFSSNYVFDGQKGEYAEIDRPNPLSVYGQSKYQGEQAIINLSGKYYLIRTSVLFGPKGQSQSSKKSFIDLMLGLAGEKNEIKAVNDEVNSITYAVDLALAVKVLLSQEFPFGVYHFSNLGEASWYDFAKEIFKLKNINVKVASVPSSAFPRQALRPKKAVLLNTKFIKFRPWQEALSDFLIPRV